VGPKRTPGTLCGSEHYEARRSATGFKLGVSELVPCHESFNSQYLRHSLVSDTSIAVLVLANHLRYEGIVIIAKAAPVIQYNYATDVFAMNIQRADSLTDRRTELLVNNWGLC